MYLTPYRILFLLAALYNVAFGIWAGLFPLAFFSTFDLEVPRYPSIWSCVGMVVGLYGILYAYVAWKPEQGNWIATVGLVGKILGPCGWLMSVTAGELPPRTFPLILANDLIWWFPLLAYLLRNASWRRAAIAWTAVAIHLTACFALLACSGGTEANPDPVARFEWVQGHAPRWTMLWLLWTASSLSLPAFCIAWCAALRERGAKMNWLAAGCAIVIAGVPFDLSGEFLMITRATLPSLNSDEFIAVTSAYRWLGAAIANGLYCVGGWVLSYEAWRSGWLRGGVGVMGMAMWTIGLALTGAAVLDHHPAMIATGAGLMLLFVSWAACVGWKLLVSDARRTRH